MVPKRLIRLKFSVKVRILHSNLGHPSKEAMCCMLKQAKAPEAVQRAAQDFACNVCRQRGRTASTVPSAIPAVTSPWEVVNVGMFWRSSPRKKGQNKPVQHCVGVSLLDECTNFHVAYVDRVDSEKTPGASRLRNKTAI